MLVLLLYLPVVVLSFIAGLTVMLLGAIFSGVFKFLLYLLAGLTLIVMSVVAVLCFRISYHRIAGVFFPLCKAGLRRRISQEMSRRLRERALVPALDAPRCTAWRFAMLCGRAGRPWHNPQFPEDFECG